MDLQRRRGRALRGRQQRRAAAVRQRGAATCRRPRPGADIELHAGTAQSARDAVRVARELHATPARRMPARELEDHLDETLDWWREWSSKMAVEGRPGVCIARSAIVLKALTMRRPAPSSPRRPRRCPSTWAASATGTIASAGSVTRCSPSRHSPTSAASARPMAFGASSSAVPPAVPTSCRCCRRRRQAPPHRDRRSITARAGAARARCASATAPTSSTRPTCTALLLELAAPLERARQRARRAVLAIPRRDGRGGHREMALPDHGIWEVRAEPRHFVHSKVMCWAAVHRGIELAQQHGFEAPLARWEQARDAIRNAIETQGVDRRARHLRCELRRARARCRTAVAARCRLRRVRRHAHGAHSAGDPARARRRRPDPALPRTPTACAATRARFCRARSGSPNAWRAKARWRRRVSCSNASCGCANDLGLFSEEYSSATRRVARQFSAGSHTPGAHLCGAGAGGSGRTRCATLAPLRVCRLLQKTSGLRRSISHRPRPEDPQRESPCH